MENLVNNYILPERIDKKLSIVIPSYNEELNIKSLYERILKILNENITRYEIIYVNNASTDRSVEIIKEIIKKNKYVSLITFSRNFGYQMAITAGLDFVEGDAVVVIDGDLQDPPELIEKFLKKWLDGYEVVYGIRKKRKGDLFRRICYKMFYRIINKLAYIDLPVDASEFALIDKKVVEHIKNLPEHNRFVRGLRAWVGFKQTGIEYIRENRKSEKTKFSLMDNIKLAFDGIFSFSESLLYMITFLGFIIVFLSFIGIIGYIIYFLQCGRVVPGFLTLIIVSLFLGGIQLLSISVVGQYIGRIFDEVKQRPKYIIRNIIGEKSKWEKV